MPMARASMTDEELTPSGSRPERAVVVTAERRLLAELIKQQLSAESSWVLSDLDPKDPGALARNAPYLRNEYGEGVAVVFVDPVTNDWLNAAEELRSKDRKIAVVVITARPSYEIQRRWRAKVSDDARRIATAMLSLESRVADIVGTVRAALDNPDDSGRWLTTHIDGEKIEVHPAAFYATDEGKKVETLRSDRARYRTLLRAGEGLSNKEIEAIEDLAKEGARDRLNKAREILDAATDVQLGRIAAELGLFVDVSQDLFDVY
jgi:hypothetical protein